MAKDSLSNPYFSKHMIKMITRLAKSGNEAYQ